MVPFNKVKGQYHSYLVRLWQVGMDPKLAATQRWQGEVIHIQSGQTWQVQDLEPLFGLLNDLTKQDQE
jgi:hypothetical protein